jgi:hypothetical protein
MWMLRESRREMRPCGCAPSVAPEPDAAPPDADVDVPGTDPDVDPDVCLRGGTSAGGSIIADDCDGGRWRIGAGDDEAVDAVVREAVQTDTRQRRHRQRRDQK